MILDEGGWDRVFMMDADLSHQPVHLAAMDRELDTHGMVIGSRYMVGVSVLNWSILRLNLSYSANKYIRFATRMPFSDCTSGFRGLRTSELPVLLTGHAHAGGYAFLVEMLYNAWRSGIDVVESPIVFVERRHGTSKISGRVFLESLVTPVRLRLGGRARRAQ